MDTACDYPDTFAEQTTDLGSTKRQPTQKFFMLHSGILKFILSNPLARYLLS